MVKFEIGWSRQAQELGTLLCLLCQETNIVFYTFIYYIIGSISRVNRVINYFLLPDYINYVSLVCMSAAYHPQHHLSLLDSVVGRGMVDEYMSNKCD